MAGDYRRIGAAWQGDRGLCFKLEGWPGYAYLFPNRKKEPGDKKPDYDICVKESVMPDVAAQYARHEYQKPQEPQAEQSQRPEFAGGSSENMDGIPF